MRGWGFGGYSIEKIRSPEASEGCPPALGGGRQEMVPDIPNVFKFYVIMCTRWAHRRAPLQLYSSF